MTCNISSVIGANPDAVGERHIPVSERLNDVLYSDIKEVCPTH